MYLREPSTALLCPSSKEISLPLFGMLSTRSPMLDPVRSSSKQLGASSRGYKPGHKCCGTERGYWIEKHFRRSKAIEPTPVTLIWDDFAAFRDMVANDSSDMASVQQNPWAHIQPGPQIAQAIQHKHLQEQHFNSSTSTAAL
jgi:hypothetical protein